MAIHNLSVRLVHTDFISSTNPTNPTNSGNTINASYELNDLNDPNDPNGFTHSPIDAFTPERRWAGSTRPLSKRVSI